MAGRYATVLAVKGHRIQIELRLLPGKPYWTGDMRIEEAMLSVFGWYTVGEYMTRKRLTQAEINEMALKVYAAALRRQNRSVAVLEQLVVTLLHREERV